MPEESAPRTKYFRPGFRRLQVVAVEGGDDVGGERLQLQAEIERDQVVGRGHHHHADGAEHEQDRELEPVDALALEVVAREQDRGRRARAGSAPSSPWRSRRR